MLADGWELSPDLSSVTINIRQGVKFHGDWGEVKAEDIAWVINRTNPALNPESIAASAANLSALFGDLPVEVVDEYTIRGTFNKFRCPLGEQLPEPGGVRRPDHHCDAEACVRRKRQELVEGELHRYRAAPGQGIQVRYKHYAGEGALRPLAKESGVAVFRVLTVPEESTRVALLQTGEADAAFIDPKDLARMHQSGFVQVSAGQGTQEGVMFPGNLWETVKRPHR